MQLSLHADYALRALMYLAVEPKASISEIAHAYGISANHLVKVVHRLGKLGYVTTRRGKGGGIRLAKPPEEIVLSDVFRDMEPSLDMVECFNRDTNTCRIVPVCALKHVLAEATEAFVSTLGKYSLNDMIKDRASMKRIFHRGFSGIEIR